MIRILNTNADFYSKVVLDSKFFYSVQISGALAAGTNLHRSVVHFEYLKSGKTFLAGPVLTSEYAVMTELLQFK